MKIKFQVVASFNYIEANADYAAHSQSPCQFLLYLHEDPTQFGCCVERFIQNHAQLENTLPLLNTWLNEMKQNRIPIKDLIYFPILR